MTPSFWFGRRVLITGNTGFKGSWLSFWLAELGAEVSGLALPPSSSPNLYDILNLSSIGQSVYADINDRVALNALFKSARPEVVIHMAAQSLVRQSYATPLETFMTNVAGTVSLLEAARNCHETRAVVIVTTDKCYENRNWHWGYRETDELGGHDPYSASKACAEIATASMRRSFFNDGGHPARIATVRAGNVIGGGDWSDDRLVPDIVRGCLGAEHIVRLRNPGAVRPWQHVLDPLSAYLSLAERLHAGDKGFDEAWNIGPESADNQPVLAVAQALVHALGQVRIEITPDPAHLHEANLLMLDCAKARARLGWRPNLNFKATVDLTAQWYQSWASGADMADVTRAQILRFME